MIRKIAIVSTLILLLFAGGALAVKVTVDDVIKLHKEGLSAEVIKSFIETSGQVFELTAEDLVKLKKAGVPDEVIKVMIETRKKTDPPEQSAPSNGEETATTPARPTITERILGVRKVGDKRVVLEPKNVSYRKKFNSVFYLCTYRKKLLRPIRLARVGRYDPLRNTAYRAGTLFLTDKEILMYDTDGDLRFRLSYRKITRIKIINRYPDEVEARYHPLDRYQLRIEYNHDGRPHFFTAYALPKPEKPGKFYGSVIDIANAVYEIGRLKNSRLGKPVLN